MATRTRRATRRTAVVDSDDEDVTALTQVPADEEEDTTPEPAASRRPTRSGRRAAAPAAPAAATARTRGRPKKSVTPKPDPDPQPEVEDDSRETTATLEEEDATVVKAEEPAEEAADVTQIPTAEPQPSTPQKRKSTAPRASMASAANIAPPTPQQSQSPESTLLQATPLTDITHNSVNTNTQLQTPATVRPIKAGEGFMDKPIDIVLKSRTVTVPFVEDTTPKSRIVLTYLILNNFKSYAGRQEVGPFHASFSSVVGPNGSGKSNVIDSLLFVFGFRASKMRQGKISALIHNSAQYPDLDHCEVAVHFQEVMDQVSNISVRKSRHGTNVMFSLAAATLSSQTRSSSSPAKRSRTTRASTTSTARSPTSPPSQPCCATAASISITSDSSSSRERSSPSRR